MVTLLMLSIGCTNDARTGSVPQTVDSIPSVSGPTAEAVAATSAEWSVRTFQNAGGLSGFGFDVLQGEKIYIHQPTIPAVQGVRGFATESLARACGELMTYKIRNGIVPPAISIAELDSIGVGQ